MSGESVQPEPGGARKLPPIYLDDRMGATDAPDEPKPPGRVNPAGAAIAILLSIPASLLPARWRQATNANSLPLAVGSVVSGTAQFLLFAGLLLNGWVQFFNAQTALPSVDTHTFENAQPYQVMGLSSLFVFVFTQPKAWAFMYMSAEALARIVSTMGGVPLGTTPLWAVDFVMRKVGKQGASVAAAAAIPDLVEDDGGQMGLRILSYRRQAWTKKDTVVVAGHPYRIIASRELSEGRRRFEYTLEPPPSWWTPENEHVHHPDAPPSETKA